MKKLLQIQQDIALDEGFLDSLKLVAKPLAITAALAAPSDTADAKPTHQVPVAAKEEHNASKIGDWQVFAKSYIKRHEGNVRHVYTDTNGFPTIGYGYKIDPHHYKKTLKDFHAAGISDVVAKKLLAIAETKEYHPPHPKKKVPNMISEEQSSRLYDLSFNEHIKRVKDRIPEFDTMPNEVKVVLLDMEYNGFLGKAVKAMLAFNKKDYKTAIAEMKDSKTYRDAQTHNRMQENVDLIQSILK